MSPAGMEPAGAARHRRSPKGRGAGAPRSIEPSRELHSVVKTEGAWSHVPGGNGARRERRDIDEARRVEARARRDQSNLPLEPLLSCQNKWRFELCPRRESNPHLRFRKPPFYPLNYGDCWICDLRFANADCPVPRLSEIRNPQLRQKVASTRRLSVSAIQLKPFHFLRNVVVGCLSKLRHERLCCDQQTMRRQRVNADSCLLVFTPKNKRLDVVVWFAPR